MDARKVPQNINDKIVALLRTGMSQDAVADALKDEGVSIYTVRTVIRNNGLQKESWRVRKEQKNQHILDLYAEGRSYNEIKEIVQAELTTIHKALKTQGLFYTKQEMAERILNLYKQGMSTTAVAKELRVSYKRVCNVVEAAGLSADMHLYNRCAIPETSQSKENILGLHKAGKSVEVISELTGLSVYQIKRDIALA